MALASRPICKGRCLFQSYLKGRVDKPRALETYKRNPTDTMKLAYSLFRRRRIRESHHCVHIFFTVFTFGLCGGLTHSGAHAPGDRLLTFPAYDGHISEYGLRAFGGYYHRGYEASVCSIGWLPVSKMSSFYATW